MLCRSSHVAFGFALAFLCAPALAQAGNAKITKAAPATNAPVAAAVEVEIPQSLFVIPATPKEGRNPFFPHSTAAAPQPVKATANLVDVSTLSLKGITSPPRATAMINNRTFEKNEEGEVKLANGKKVLVRVEQINDDSVIILVNGSQRRELHLRSGV